MLGPDALTTFVNARMAEMLGYSVEEMIGKPVTAFMFEEDVHDHLEKMTGRRRGISERYERQIPLQRRAEQCGLLPPPRRLSMKRFVLAALLP